MVNFLYKLFVPTRCKICGDVIGFLPYCEKCKNVQSGLFLGKAKPRNLNESQLNYVSGVFSVYDYCDGVKQGFRHMKFSNRRFLIKYFSDKMADLAVDLNKSFNIVMPVPSTKKRIHLRKGNITLQMARQVSKAINTSCTHTLLIKRFDTCEQHKLQLSARQCNLMGSMTVTQPEKIKDKNILLIDDLITSGNTIDYCSKILLAYGASSVVGITYASVSKQAEK